MAGDQETKAAEETADGSPLGMIFKIKAKYQTPRFIIACCASVIGNLVFEENLDSTRLIRLLLVDIRTLSSWHRGSIRYLNLSISTSPRDDHSSAHSKHLQCGYYPLTGFRDPSSCPIMTIFYWLKLFNLNFCSSIPRILHRFWFHLYSAIFRHFLEHKELDVAVPLCLEVFAALS